VTQAYLLSTGVLLLPAGKLGDLLGHARVYLAGFVLFSSTALLAGLANGLETLLAARLLQGAGGALVAATGPALLTTTTDPSRRGRALGVVATATYTGLTAGPPLGGAIVSALGWRWIFFVHLPVGALVLAAGALCLPRARPARPASFDWRGAALLVASLPPLLVALSEGSRLGFGHPAIWGSGLAGIVAVGVFVAHERRCPSPLLDLSLFRSPALSGAVLSALANYVALFVATLLLPFFLEEGLRHHPAAVGMLLAMQPLVMAAVASPSGWLSDRIGSRGLAMAGMLGVAAGLLCLSSLDGEASRATVAACLAVVGLGTGVFISPNSSALLGAAPRAQQGAAASLLAEARVLGMLLGVALGSILFALAGGHSGQAWTAVDFGAMALALRVAAGVAVLGALAAALRGR
jgi:EmrB/QacA subfamily drug resistance transporter